MKMVVYNARKGRIKIDFQLTSFLSTGILRKKKERFVRQDSKLFISRGKKGISKIDLHPG